jgi:hypothetical protein
MIKMIFSKIDVSLGGSLSDDFAFPLTQFTYGIRLVVFAPVFCRFGLAVFGFIRGFIFEVTVQNEELHFLHYIQM